MDAPVDITSPQAFVAACRRRLAQAAQEREHPWRTFALATASRQVGPAARMVVLRGVDPGPYQLWFHTHAQASKVASLRETGRCAALFWDPRAGLQLRLEGTAHVTQDGERVEAAWRDLPAASRRVYASRKLPAARRETAGCTVPPPDAALDLGAARAAFCMVVLRVQLQDALWLRRPEHVRARASCDAADGSWQAGWVEP